MKKLKYISAFILLFGCMAISCNDENVKPLKGGDEDEDPVVAPPPPPPPPVPNSAPLDSLG